MQHKMNAFSSKTLLIATLKTRKALKWWNGLSVGGSWLGQLRDYNERKFELIKTNGQMTGRWRNHNCEDVAEDVDAFSAARWDDNKIIDSSVERQWARWRHGRGDNSWDCSRTFYNMITLKWYLNFKFATISSLIAGCCRTQRTCHLKQSSHFRLGPNNRLRVGLAHSRTP